MSAGSSIWLKCWLLPKPCKPALHCCGPLREANVESTGKVIIGTVKGDLHDIGKNLVAMILEGAGFEVIDLGTDVSPRSVLSLPCRRIHHTSSHCQRC